MRNYRDSYAKAGIDVSKLVETEVGAFKELPAWRKTQKLGMYIKNYIKARELASRFASKEKTSTYGKYKARREQNEYVELLSSTRVMKFMEVLTEEEWELFVRNVKEVFDSVFREQDPNRLMEIYEYLSAVCIFCKHINTSFVNAEMSVISETLPEILKKAMGVTPENEM